jgi:conjugal transfer pilus assembly protein TraE
MNKEQANSDLKDLRSTVNRQRIANMGLVAGIFVSLLIILNIVGRERTLITPPTISKSFWIEHGRVDPAYLEQMGAWIATLILDVSPQSIEFKKTTLLGYVTPADYGALQTRQNLEAERLKRLNATTQFSVDQIVADENLTVWLKGRLATFINGQRTSDTEKAYRVIFEDSGSRIHLKKFEEVDYATQNTVAAASADK